MKPFITFLLLVSTLFTKAQVINIPDPEFKNVLVNYYPVIDVNGDGEIQVSEALAVSNLSIPQGPVIRDITGIREFKNLDTFYATNESLEVLDINGLDKLLYFTGMADSIAPNCFFGCDKLKKMLLSIGHASNFNPGRLDSLKYFDLLKGDIGILDMRDCNSLVNFKVSPDPSINGRIGRIYLDNIDSLREFDISVGVGPGVYTVDSIDLTGCKNLLSFQGSTGAFGNLQHLNLAGCHNLAILHIWQSKLRMLDLSACYKLTNCLVHSSEIMTFNCKNGHADPFSMLYMRPGSNICADDFEISNIEQLASQGAYTPTVTSYCTFFPGGPQNKISGISRLIANNNGCENTDRVLSNVPIKITDAADNRQVNYTGTNGMYTHYAGQGSFTLTPYFPYPYFSITPAVTTVAFDTANSLTETRNFCVVSNGTHNDLEITFLPTFPPARPGLNASYALLYKNRGTTTLSGNVAVNFDNNKMNFVSASENVTTQSSGQLLWNYNNLQPFENRTIHVTFNLLPPPVNNIGDTISYLAVITPSDNDETAFDNIFILPQTVNGSFDPNDKQCIEGSNLDISKIGDYLHYQIRFQNEGTDTAFNIVIADTLSDNLDWNTFEYIGSSHTADVKLSNNKLEFFYSNINLPYKAIDEPGSNGWVAFKIKPKPSVVIGDSLNNSAAIYFDFNLPVVTNTATTIVSSAATPVPVKLEYFSVNKKENVNQLNWKTSCTYGNAAFVMERSDDGIHFKAIGNITATALRCQLPFNFTDNNPAAGKNYYRLKISDADGKNFYSKTLVVGNDKAGLEITAVAHNIVYLNSNKQQLITMSVVAADGRQVFKQKQTVGSGNNNISLQMENAAKGIYTLFVYTSEGDAITKRFIK